MIKISQTKRGLLILTILVLFSLNACDRFAAQPAVAGIKTMKPLPSPDTSTDQPTILPTDTASPLGEVINPTSAPNLQLAGGMVESEATGFAWALGADENTEKIALSLASFVKIVSGDPPIAEIQIPDTTPSLLTAASQSSTIAWKNVDDAVRVWNLATGEELLSITGIQAAVTGLSLSAAGDILAVSTYDGSLQVWDLLSGQLHHEWKMPVWLSNLDFSPDTRLLAGVDTPNFTVRMIDLATGSEVRSLSWTEHASPVLYGAHFSPDWRQLAWVARGSIQLMDVNSGDLGPMLNHEDFVNAIAWSPDGSLIASAAAGTVNGDYAPLVLLWDAANGQKVETLVLKNPVNGIEFSPDGRELAILDSNGTLHIWIVQP